MSNIEAGSTIGEVDATAKRKRRSKSGEVVASAMPDVDAVDQADAKRAVAQTDADQTGRGRSARSGAATTTTPKETKAEVVLKKLRLARGVTVDQLKEATGWQAHSVRGFLSAVVKKKLGLTLISEVGKDGQRRYRIADDAGKAG